jgi:hypothetical protein
MVTVVNIRKTHMYHVYIGRPGGSFPDAPFGNPFTVEEHGRGIALAKFSRWFKSDEPAAVAYRTKVDEVIGPDDTLGCFCTPNPCHGDIIAAYVNNGYKV